MNIDQFEIAIAVFDVFLLIVLAVLLLVNPLKYHTSRMPPPAPRKPMPWMLDGRPEPPGVERPRCSKCGGDLEIKILNTVTGNEQIQIVSYETIKK